MGANQPSGRRWSRTVTPGHYGSQLLCEVINYSNRRSSTNPSPVPAVYEAVMGSSGGRCRLPSPPPTPIVMASSPTTVIPPPPMLDDNDSAGRCSSSSSLQSVVSSMAIARPRNRNKRYPIELQKAIRDVQFIQNHMKREDEYDEARILSSFSNKKI